MTEATFDAATVGDEVIRLETDPISRTTLALYAGASGDHNPMHIDLDYAKKAGESDVFAHGMLVMGYMARSLLQYAPQTALRSFSTQFKAITRIGEKIICTGTVAEKLEEGGEKRVKLALTAANQDGQVKAAGEAVVALP